MYAFRHSLSCLFILAASWLWLAPAFGDKAGETKPAAPSAEPTNAKEAAAKKAAEDSDVAARYQALVATLPADQQAWERTLEQNLGNFYLPIHKRLRVQGRSSCWDFVQDDPQLPRVLLIGDSISGGYTLPTRKALAGEANVHKAPENCGPTANGLKKLDVWLGDGRWDVIHFNFGIHDRKTPTELYAQRLEQLIARLEKTGAKLIWASTTPVPAGTKDGPAMPAAIVERNRVAAAIMQRRGIPIDDLYATLLPQEDRVMKSDNVHPNGEGYALLGQQVAAAIEAALKPAGAK
ncbi:MAG TPA: SGNH/GDSL hydrolase family protein [Pirellulales bacterium]